MILAIDPGKDKCGLAFFNKDGKVVEQKIIKRHDLFRQLAHYQVTTLVIGDSANGREINRELAHHHSPAKIVLFPEQNTTRQAKEAYWRAHPPQGWRRFVPTSFLSVPVPVDDYAAAIIGERYLKS